MNGWWKATNWQACLPLGLWVHAGRFFNSGELRLAVLSLLGEGPKHGYELIKILEARSGGLYRASAGAIYPTLQQLEDEGLVSSEREGGKNVYKLTEAGKAELAREAQVVQRIWRRTEGCGDWADCMGPQVAMVAKPVGRLVKSAFRAVTQLADEPDDVRRIQEILERASRDLDELKRGR